MADQIIEYEGYLDETTVDNVFAEMITRVFMEQFECILTFDEANPTVLSRVDEDGTTRTISIISDEGQGVVQIFAGDTDQLLVLSAVYTADETDIDDLTETIMDTILGELELGGRNPCRHDTGTCGRIEETTGHPQKPGGINSTCGCSTKHVPLSPTF